MKCQQGLKRYPFVSAPLIPIEQGDFKLFLEIMKKEQIEKFRSALKKNQVINQVITVGLSRPVCLRTPAI